jgi:hypothetical protein
MRCIPIILASLAFPALAFAAPDAAGDALPAYDSTAPAEAQVPKLYAAWEAERDSARRAQIGGELVEAIMHEEELPQADIADEVARDGLPLRIITPPAAEKVALSPFATLNGVHSNDSDYPASPVFRRVADDRFEAWTTREGWLFDGKGHLLTHVKVPRRDGTGREWFGSLLPDGTWITTDLWEQDEQINAFNAQGRWLWEVKGSDILKQLPPAAAKDATGKPLICWARADRIGHGWEVCVGEDDATACALVAEEKTVAPVPDDESAWDLVYPRAMGVRGMFTNLRIVSDDGDRTLVREEAGHGISVGWPSYSVTPGEWRRVIHSGDDYFGFWPRSHALFIEAEGNEFFSPHRVWFFDDAGRYTGQISGSYLADAGNKYGLLITSTGGAVATLMPAPKGPTVTQARAFTWPDGSRAVPLALYDDLHLGFFLHGPDLDDTNPDAARRARATADIVLAKWRM